MKEKTKFIAIGFVGIFIVLVVFIGMFVLGKTKESPNDISEVTIQKDGGTLTVKRDGSVYYQFGDEVYTDQWSLDKTDTYFKHFSDNYLTEDTDLISGGGNYVTVVNNGSSSTYKLGDDELVDVVIDDTSGGDGSGGGGSTPTPVPTYSGGGSTATPAPTSSGGSGGGYIDPNCLYWKLSYCVRLRTPLPTSTPGPSPETEIREPNCEDNTQTGKTVISNELCVPTPTPTSS